MHLFKSVQRARSVFTVPTEMCRPVMIPRIFVTKFAPESHVKRVPAPVVLYFRIMELASPNNNALRASVRTFQENTSIKIYKQIGKAKTYFGTHSNT